MVSGGVQTIIYSSCNNSYPFKFSQTQIKQGTRAKVLANFRSIHAQDVVSKSHSDCLKPGQSCGASDCEDLLRESSALLIWGYATTNLRGKRFFLIKN
jgi:hypothetical protein